jgi:peptide/nickel transport system substrate-binding protein
MTERELRALVEDVKAGRLSRRSFVTTMVGLGLTAPFAHQMLAGVAHAQTSPAFVPTKRGGGGALKVLWWEAPGSLNPTLALGVKDWNVCALFYEPLVYFDVDGIMTPVLAREIPNLQNGGVSKDGTVITWRLKRGVQWHDGKPFTSDDFLFYWEWASDPATGSPSIANFRNVKSVEAPDSHTVKVTFNQPTPYWITGGMIIPRHIFGPYKGTKSREAPNNNKPVGTGPYRFVDFKPGDLLKAELNPNYHVPNRPFFDTIEVKGGGDAVSAARAVLQTGEYDYAGEVASIDDDVLARLEASGKGRVAPAYGGRILHIALNQSDPWKEVDGERSSAKTKHPFLTDPAVYGARSLLVDRANIQEQIYGRTARATGNFLNNPERFRSKNTRAEFNVDKANQMLDGGGWKRGADGVRAKDGKRLKVLFSSITNSATQRVQAIVKQAATKAGFDVELKSVAPAVFYGSDPANTDTYTHFYADLQLQVYTMGPPDPALIMRVFTSDQIASKENKWQRFNVWRFKNEEYDKLYLASQTEMDPVKRAALFIRMNDIVVQNGVVIPIAMRAKASAQTAKLRNAETNPYEIDFWNIAFWYREV